MASSQDETLAKYVDATDEVIDSAYATLQATFASHVTLERDYRLYNLKQLAFLIKDNVPAIQRAVGSDISKGWFDVEVSDLWPILNEIELAVRRLSTWMRTETRYRDSLLSFKLMHPRVVKQPKGVALIISPWNYPWQLTLSPLVGAIAAGCPAILKVSEHSPASSALLAELIPRYLDPAAYQVILGGPAQSTRLLEKQWGHILFTGSASVGKIVAAAAAKTLTPTTLELGGKSPVIVSSCADVAVTARRLLSIKVLNSGQMCVSPDYVLCAADRVDEFIEACTTTLSEFFPPHPSPRSALSDSIQSCSLRNAHDFERLQNVLDKMESQGKLLYRGEADESRRRMGISLVRLNRGAQGEDGLLIEEEIFGPIVPIIPIADVDEAIRYVNERPKPLALYVCSSKRKVFNTVAKYTTSGSAMWNDFGFATIASAVPFGGVGDSGWGAYHGAAGFDTFTHRKTVLEVSLWLEPIQKIRYPPNLTAFGQRLFRHLLVARLGFSRPVSVEHGRDAAAIDRRRVQHKFAWGLIVFLLGMILRSTSDRWAPLIDRAGLRFLSL